MPDRQQLEAQFHERCLNLAAAVSAARGAYPGYFSRGLEQDGAVATAERLVLAQKTIRDLSGTGPDEATGPDGRGGDSRPSVERTLQQGDSPNGKTSPGVAWVGVRRVILARRVDLRPGENRVGQRPADNPLGTRHGAQRPDLDGCWPRGATRATAASGSPSSLSMSPLPPRISLDRRRLTGHPRKPTFRLEPPRKARCTALRVLRCAKMAR